MKKQDNGPKKIRMDVVDYAKKREAHFRKKGNKEQADFYKGLQKIQY